MAKLNPEGTVKRLFKILPKMPGGEIDYTNSKVAVVVTVFIKYKKKVLLVKRSQKVSGYKGKWNSISGYVDQIRPIREIALKEIDEEVGLAIKNVLKVTEGKAYSFIDKKEKMRWIVCPYLVESKKKPIVKLDWENTEYRWIDPDYIAKFDIVPNLDKSLSRLIKL